MNKNIPAVSIIIPMYNAEKYIGDCLNSILDQTFQDFEVIVVDDCSTDKSCDIVESYIGNVDIDRAKLVRRKINSGASGVTRYEGLLHARGEYILFIDSDDMITETALEELYPIAKKFNADVVHCEKFFTFNDENDSENIAGCGAGNYVTEPTLITDDLAERVKGLHKYQYIWNLWSKLIRREFILKNNLKMINGIAADAMFTCLLVCSAKRYVRVPNIINFYRIVENSISHKDRTPAERIHAWMNSLAQGFQLFDKFLSEHEFFQKRPNTKYLALEVWVRECCNYLIEIYEQVPAWQLYEIICHELEEVKDNTALMAFLFSRMNIFNVQLKRQDLMMKQMNAQNQNQNQIIQQLQSQIQK